MIRSNQTNSHKMSYIYVNKSSERTIQANIGIKIDVPWSKLGVWMMYMGFLHISGPFLQPSSPEGKWLCNVLQIPRQCCMSSLVFALVAVSQLQGHAISFLFRASKVI